MNVHISKNVWLLFVSISLLTSPLIGQIVEGELPKEIIECVQLSQNKTTDPSELYTSTADTHANCLELFLWKSDKVQWHNFNITEKDRKFVNSLIGSYVHRRRTKRQAGPGGIFPQTGFRIRREYRRLSDGERFAYHAAVNQMKMSGQYDTFANLHQGMVVTSAHNGPNFLGWHRVYLSMYEEALRRVNPMLSLPYWDSSLDFDMANPANSIIWSSPFLGNGDGFVTTGPFANWDTPVGRLTRNVGSGSRLFSKEVIRDILSRCRLSEISEPTALIQFSLEVAHGGPHVWVGGQMSGLNTAAHDPVFFMHHAFVDYIWEIFRIRQARFCNVNPSTDYPPAMGEHAPQRPMDGFPQYRNIDGIRGYWTRFWYRYERSPRCSMWRPFCRTPYLRCDIGRRRCISVERMGPGPAPAGMAGARMAFAARDGPQTATSAMRARAQESSIRIGPRFRAPPAEPRTQDAQRGMRGMRGMPMGRFRRAVNQSEESHHNNNSNKLNSKQAPPSDFGPSFAAPPSDGRTSDVLGDAFTGGIIGFDPAAESVRGDIFPSSDPAPLLPSSDYQQTPVNDMLKTPVRNTFNLNGHSNVSNWAFIPVRVIYTNSQRSRFSNYPDLSLSYTGSTQGGGNRRCIQDPSGAIQVKVQSSGLNYYGTFTDYALIDSRLPSDVTISYIGVKSPKESPTEVLISAVHSCGLMCQAHCVVPFSNPIAFRPCSGVLNIDSNDRALYGKTYREAVTKVWHEIQVHGIQPENVRIALYCSDTDVSPWNVYN